MFCARRNNDKQSIILWMCPGAIASKAEIETVWNGCEKDADDVVLFCRQYMADKQLSQAPFLVLPAPFQRRVQPSAGPPGPCNFSFGIGIHIINVRNKDRWESSFLDGMSFSGDDN